MEGRAASWELFFADADKEAAVLPGSTLARLDADIPDSSVEAGGSTGPSKRRSNPAGWISDPHFNEIIGGIAKIARGALRCSRSPHYADRKFRAALYRAGPVVCVDAGFLPRRSATFKFFHADASATRHPTPGSPPAMRPKRQQCLDWPNWDQAEA
jgi:hypothetical protein